MQAKLAATQTATAPSAKKRSMIVISDNDDLCDFVVPKSDFRPVASVKKSVFMPKQSMELYYAHRPKL